jgi:glycosyltransferase involved in cell wall biosynthesis
VRQLGFVSEEDLIALYRGAVALTFASFFGPNNFPPLEAMALSCPVLCADAAGMREQLGDAALYFEPTDAATLAQLIRTIDEDTGARASLIEKGRARAARIRGVDYVRGVLGIFDEFQPIRDTWGPPSSYTHP